MVPKTAYDQFRVREESNRAKLLALLCEHFGNQVAASHLLDGVFGRKKGSTKALSDLRGSLERTIVKRKLPYKFVRLKTQKGETIGLYPVEKEDCQIVAGRATLAAINPKAGLTGDDS